MPDLAFLEGHDLAVYSADSCPDCARLKRWIGANGVPAREISIEDDPAAAEKLERETGKRAIPFVLVDGKRWVRGYHKERPGRFDPELLLAELRAAVAP